MKFEYYAPTTWLFWVALMVITVIADQSAVIGVAAAAFTISLVWQLVQFIVIRRQQRKAHLEA